MNHSNSWGVCYRVAMIGAAKCGIYGSSSGGREVLVGPASSSTSGIRASLMCCHFSKFQMMVAVVSHDRIVRVAHF